jgi:glycosyltransferase involved in cell wall biosynthesis
MGVLGHAGRRVESIVAALPVTHLTVSHHTADTLARIGRKAQAVIPPGFDPPALGPAEIEANPSDILFVGRMVPTKNLGLLIEATTTLVARGLKPQVLVIGDGPMRVHWQAQVERRGLGELFEFTGALHDDVEVLASLAATKILALPSIREGFGMIALEAAAYGIPVVTVNHPRNAASHFVEHGVTGLCVEPTTSAFADGLQALLQNEALRLDLSAGALSKAPLATWDAAVSGTEAVYRSRVA